MPDTIPGSVEIISPFFRLQPNVDWRKTVRRFWTFLQRYYRLTNDAQSYGTRIYMSHDQGYSQTEYYNLASAIMTFDPVITELVPSRSWSDQSARSIKKFNHRFHGMTAPECVGRIRMTESQRAFHSLLKGRGGKQFSWVFDNHPAGMIEFRQSPPSLCAEDALTWAELTLNFVQVALDREDIGEATDVPDVGHLHSFLQSGHFQQSALGSPELLARVWNWKQNWVQACRAERARHRGSPVSTRATPPLLALGNPSPR